VKGHDFSRAAKAIRMRWALAPEVCLLPIPHEIQPFSAACLAPEAVFRSTVTPTFCISFISPTAMVNMTLVWEHASNETLLLIPCCPLEAFQLDVPP